MTAYQTAVKSAKATKINVGYTCEFRFRLLPALGDAGIAVAYGATTTEARKNLLADRKAEAFFAAKS